MESKNTIVSSVEELESIFEHDGDRKSILDKFVTPKPGDGGKVITILNTKGDDGTLGVVNIVNNPKFTNGKGVFMTVEEYDNPGVEKQLGLSKSLFNSFDRLCNTEHWKLTELPGKIVHITANWYKKINCNECHGKGCLKCDNTGHSIVFNVRSRNDLMSPTKQSQKGDEF